MKENWNTFDYTSKEGITIRVEWWPKDFVAIFESDEIRLSTGLHIMYMCPKKYTEEMLRSDYCEDSCKLLNNACDLLQKNPDFIQNYKEKLNSEFSAKYVGFAALQEERRNKLQQFKAGEISQQEWTIFCKQYNKALSNNYYEKSDFTRSYVRSIVGENITLQNILMDYLEKNCN